MRRAIRRRVGGAERSCAAQPGGLPEISRGSRSAATIPPVTGQINLTHPGGVPEDNDHKFGELNAPIVERNRNLSRDGAGDSWSQMCTRAEDNSGTPPGCGS